MSLRLKALKRNISGEIQSLDKRKDVEAAIDGIAGFLPGFSDQSFETFIVDQISRISGDIYKNVDASVKAVLKLNEFCHLLVKSNIRSLNDLPTTKPLKQLFADFISKLAPLAGIDELVGTTSSMATNSAVQDIEVPDPHVYLKDIEMLDESCLMNESVLIKDVASKLMAVINVSLPLLEAGGTADQRESKTARNGRQQSNASAIEGILNMVTGDQAKLHTRRIFQATKPLRNLMTSIKDVESDRDSLEARHDKPWLFMLQKDQQIPEEKFRRQMEWFESEITSTKQKLKLAIDAFNVSPEWNELIDSLQKLNKHIDINIIGALNSVIARIRAAGIKSVVLSKDDLERGRSAGIKIESVLATSESPIVDLESINHAYFKAKEHVDQILTTLSAKLAKRANEERAIVENGILSALEHILEDYESNQKGTSGSGFLCMASLARGMEIGLLELLAREIDRLAILLSERGIEPASMMSLLDAIGITSTEFIDVETLDAQLNEKKLAGTSFDAAVRLLRYTPLNREAYFDPKIAASREQLAQYTAQLKMFESILHVLVDLGGKIEDLDPYLPRKFMAIADFRAPTSFSEVIDTWYAENVGRLFTAGGQDMQREITEKIAAVKAKLASLEGMLVVIPPELVSKMKALPLPVHT